MDFGASGGQGTGGWAVATEISWEYARQHDPANAELFLTTNPDAIGIEGSLIDEGSLIAADRAMVAMDVARSNATDRLIPAPDDASERTAVIDSSGIVASKQTFASRE